MKVQLNTNLFPLISVGMYNSNIDSDSIFSDFEINDDKENGYIHFDSDYFWNNFKNDLYKKRIGELASEYIGNKLENEDGIVINIKCGKIYSPKYYNFSTDEMVLEVTYPKGKILKLINDKYSEDFDKFLKDNYSSYDGFTSFTSNNYNDWLVDFEDNESRSVGAALRYLFLNWEVDNDLEGFDTFVYNQNLRYTDFVDFEDHDKEVEVLHKYVKDNYLTINIDTIDFDTFEFEILDTESCIKVVKEVLQSIDNKTMSMF